MKKYYIAIAAATVLLSACGRSELNDVIEPQQEEIGFSTFTSRITKAENSSATETNALQAHHTTFKVWGSKYVAGTETPVFTAQEVKHNGTDWTYTPKRFWDKSATKYDFYAAAPASLSWSWDNTNKKLSLSDFAVDGATIAASTSVNANAVMPNGKDIMISEDITNHTTYTSTKVNLHFIHLLSRLNIGVKKATPVLDDFIVKLKEIKVYNMTSNGSFNENTTLGDGVLEGGTTARWSPATTPAKFTSGVGYTTETTVTTDYNYVYQSLVIPQVVDYVADVKLNGTGLDENSKPYLNIKYEIWTNGTPSEKVDEYSYYYNLADIFNGNGSSATENIAFNEGWQNTLKININPTAIEFEADVYEWAPDKNVEIDVPDEVPAP